MAIYRDVVTANTLDDLLTKIANKIIERNNGWEVVTSTEYYLLKHGNIYMRMCKQGNSALNLLIGTQNTNENTSIAICFISITASGNAGDNFKVNINCYKADNNNCIYKFGNYNDSTDGLNFSLVSLLDDTNVEETTNLVYYNNKIYSCGAETHTVYGTVLTNSRTHVKTGYVYMNNAEIINANLEIIGKHMKSTYEVVSDGGLAANHMYTIGDDTYTYSGTLLWKV